MTRMAMRRLRLPSTSIPVNNPLGSTWVALFKPSYGIHGTPHPSQVGKSESHDRVRVTNWDAQRLGGTLTKGIPVNCIEKQG
jgi:lipoprotein-anchoring transpeptidase ErfK/SrfK